MGSQVNGLGPFNCAALCTNTHKCELMQPLRIFGLNVTSKKIRPCIAIHQATLCGARCRLRLPECWRVRWGAACCYKNSSCLHYILLACSPIKHINSRQNSRPTAGPARRIQPASDSWNHPFQPRAPQRLKNYHAAQKKTNFYINIQILHLHTTLVKFGIATKNYWANLP
jgi:hypothetical protein